MFQQVALCFERIKFDWTDLAKDRATFCMLIIHYENFGRRTCNCRREDCNESVNNCTAGMREIHTE
jgi:hypothetical protein